MNHVQPQDLVLSIYPFSRGFAFVFFEGSESPFDWGVKEVKEKHKNTKTLDEIKKLIVHGILHLLGYDHKKKRDKEMMREKESRLMFSIKEL